MNSTSWFGRKARDASEAAVEATGLLHKSWIQDPTAPLFFLVHGRAGNRDMMWTFTYSVPPTVNLLFPEGFLTDPDDGGHSWWLKRKMTDENVLHAAERLLHFIRASIDHYSLKPSRIVALGFSQGAGVLSVLLQDEPMLFAGVASLAGFVVERERTNLDGPGDPSYITSPATDVFMAHGTKDPIIPLEMAQRGATFLTDQGHSVEFHTDDVEHKVGKIGMRALKTWTQKFVDVPNGHDTAPTL